MRPCFLVLLLVLSIFEVNLFLFHELARTRDVPFANDPFNLNISINAMDTMLLMWMVGISACAFRL